MMILKNLKEKQLVLASGSPRRQQLLKDMGLEFEVIVPNVKEDFPSDLLANQVAPFLADKKSCFFDENDLIGKIVITSDTTVCLENTVLNKPQDRDDAIRMIKLLSDNCHDVVTGVCLKTKGKKVVFAVESTVFFKKLSLEEIEYYVDTFRPFDKAGAYGIQEWIGYVGIERIEGSFYNVMGLPTQRLWEELKVF